MHEVTPPRLRCNCSMLSLFLTDHAARSTSVTSAWHSSYTSATSVASFGSFHAFSLFMPGPDIGTRNAFPAETADSRPTTCWARIDPGNIGACACYARSSLGVTYGAVRCSVPTWSLELQVDVGRVIAAVGNAMLQPRPEVADQEDGDG
eukprot:1365708-Rhodomonas_salina.3